LGLNGKSEHILTPGEIPVIHSDRGGQATYHGPGQLIVYVLIDVKRLNMGVRPLVTLLENTMIDVLNRLCIAAYAKPDAPGVYVDEKKIGSIGIRIKHHASYHGISLNNNMDLTPFEHINTCGFKNLQVTQLADFGVTINNDELGQMLCQHLLTYLINDYKLSSAVTLHA
jgi:lipoyl(octanoyl) transferase